MLCCCRNHQFLADFDLVGIFQVVGFRDDGVLVGIAVKCRLILDRLSPGWTV